MLRCLDFFFFRFSIFCWIIICIAIFVKSLIAGPVSEVSVEVAARSEIAAIAIDEAALLLGLLLIIISINIVMIR